MGVRKIKRWFQKSLHHYDFPNLVKSKPWDIQPTDRICLLAPHADDEAIGCGGLLVKYGAQCDVVLLTDGRKGGDRSQSEKVIATRKEEFLKAMKFFKVSDFKRLEIVDGHLIEGFDLFRSIDFTPYDYVVMPHAYDGHKDHVVPQAFFKRIKKENPNIRAKAVYYEVWSTLQAPTHYLDITEVVEKKREGINLYVSQVQGIDYASRIVGLNHYRGLKHHIAYEEDFIIE